MRAGCRRRRSAHSLAPSRPGSRAPPEWHARGRPRAHRASRSRRGGRRRAPWRRGRRSARRRRRPPAGTAPPRSATLRRRAAGRAASSRRGRRRAPSAAGARPGSTPGLGPRLVDGGPARRRRCRRQLRRRSCRRSSRPDRSASRTRHKISPEAGPALRAEATVGAVRVTAGGAVHRVGSTASASSGARNGCPAGRDRISAPVTSNHPRARSTTLANISDR